MNTDEWCTPKFLADAVGPVDLDVCGNAKSHIQSKKRYGLDLGLDGLSLPWLGLVWANFPYSAPLPWCLRLRDHDGPWVALAKLDPSTRWWAVLMEANPTVAPFRKRLKFEGAQTLTANFPSVLVFSAWRPSTALVPHLWLSTYATAIGSTR